MNELFNNKWPGFRIDKQFPLAQTADAHEYVENKRASGRVVVNVPGESGELLA